MIIKSLELHNFRQFMDDEDGHGQKIIFSTDPEKKATLLIAKNATGKTTLLRSFSWIFYGKATGLKSIVNVDMKDDMLPGEQRKIEGIVVLEHLGRDYVIDRYAKAQKSNVQVRVGDSFLKITYTDEDGNNKELLGRDAAMLVTEIVPEDLFSYFFFQGENIEAIGQEISSGKSSGSSKFVKAIRGMLGFNWLYNEQTDLKAVIRDYQNEIAANSTDKKTQELQKKINTAVANIEKYTDEKNALETSLEELKRSKEEVSNEIIKSGDVADKQRETIRLGVAIERAGKDLEAKRKEVFSDFSAYGYRILAQDFDVMADKLEEGYIVELEGIGFFSLSLSSRPVMDKSEIRSESIHFRSVNFRCGKYLKKKLKTMHLERMPETQSTLPSFEERLRRLTNHLNTHHYITCGDYRELTGCSKYRALQDLNKLIDEGKLAKHGYRSTRVYSFPSAISE